MALGDGVRGINVWGPILSVLVVFFTVLLSILFNDNCPCLRDRLARPSARFFRFIGRYLCCGWLCGLCKTREPDADPKHPHYERRRPHSSFFASNTRFVALTPFPEGKAHHHHHHHHRSHPVGEEPVHHHHHHHREQRVASVAIVEPAGPVAEATITTREVHVDNARYPPVVHTEHAVVRQPLPPPAHAAAPVIPVSATAGPLRAHLAESARAPEPPAVPVPANGNGVDQVVVDPEHTPSKLQRLRLQPRTFWAFDVLDPAHLVTSYFLPPILVFIGYLCVALYLAAILLIMKFGENNLGPWWLTYFTYWSISLFGIAGLVAALNTLRYLPRLVTTAPRPDNTPSPAKGGSAVRLSKKHPGGVELTPAAGAPEEHGRHHTRPVSEMDPAGHVVVTVEERESVAKGVTNIHMRRTILGLYVGRPLSWDWLSVAHCLLMEVSITSALTITLFYWIGLVALANDRDSSVNTASNYMIHAGNSVLALLIIIFTRQPMVSYHLTAEYLYVAAYAIFLWIYGEVSGIWRYGFDWDNVRGIVGPACLAILIFLVFGFWYLVAKLRERLGRRRVARAGDQSSAGLYTPAVAGVPPPAQVIRA